MTDRKLTYTFTLDAYESEWLYGVLRDYDSDIMMRMRNEAEVKWCEEHLKFTGEIKKKMFSNAEPSFERIMGDDGVPVILVRSNWFIPGGRKKTDSSNSGEWFREDVLESLLNEYVLDIVIELDNENGYTTGFLQEAFGGLSEAHKNRVHVKSNVQSRVRKAERYMKMKGNDGKINS